MTNGLALTSLALAAVVEKRDFFMEKIGTKKVDKAASLKDEAASLKEKSTENV